MGKQILLTGIERRLGRDELIVSKTDPRGRITYVNEVFQKIAGYEEAELRHQPHAIVRHPAMPRCVFKLMWEVIEQKREIFAYVVNRAKNGDHYWVFAHVTPTLDGSGNIVGYHSNRRSPDPQAVAKVQDLYRELSAIEARHENRKLGMQAASEQLTRMLRERGTSYDRFVLSL